MSKNPLIILFALLLLVLPLEVAAQQPVQWDPERALVSRDDLTGYATQLEAIANGSEWPGDLRDQSRQLAAIIRGRLSEGDFKPGDRLVVTIFPAPIEPIGDTVVVGAGPSVDLPSLGQISLQGVLRSELEEHLTRELSKYIRNPRVTAKPTIRLLVMGTSNPGFHDFPADMLLSDVIMAAGGPGGSSDLDDIKLRRGDTLLYPSDETRAALAQGRSIDQLNLQPGDELEIPVEGPSFFQGRLFRFGAIIATSALLGRRIFF